jgi:hypothetical protein
MLELALIAPSPGQIGRSVIWRVVRWRVRFGDFDFDKTKPPRAFWGAGGGHLRELRRRHGARIVRPRTDIGAGEPYDFKKARAASYTSKARAPLKLAAYGCQRILDASGKRPAVRACDDLPTMKPPPMEGSRRHHPIVIALWANVLLLAGILVVLLSRGSGSSSLLPMALGADADGRMPMAPQPIAGGAGLFLMPGQFSQTVWGCYIMDVDRQTLCAYTVSGSPPTLRLVAARNFTYDRQLKNFNTGDDKGGMSPDEVRKMVQRETESERVKQGDAAPAPAESPAKSQD